MKKLMAFATASVLFIICIVVIHFGISGKVSESEKGFGTWDNRYKDMSYSAIANHIDKETFMLLGSSEFQHGNKSPAHPTKFYRKADMDVMCVGAAYNQCLSHAITVGATGPFLKSKKVVLILSPSWFDKSGVEKEAFCIRFSESQYLAMLKNDQLSDELKKDIADRTELLLRANPAMRGNIKESTDRILYQKNKNVFNKAWYKARGEFINERELISVASMWQMEGKRKYLKDLAGEGTAEPDFNKLRKSEERSFDNNPFHIKNNIYKKKFKPVMKKQKGAMKNRRMLRTSPEFGDLELFLKVCEEQDIKVELVLLPLNGWWYDYTGFTKEYRDKLPPMIKQTADSYGVKFKSFYDNDYNDGWLEDVFHPSGKGWVDINEEVYRFFKQG